MKQIRRLAMVILVIVILLGIKILFGGGTDFRGGQRHLYIYPDKQNYRQQIEAQLDSEHIIAKPVLFRMLAKYTAAYKNLTPGRFTVKNGESIFTILRMLKRNKQDIVQFTVKRVRTVDGFAGMLGNKFITDSLKSLAFLKNNDSLGPFGVDTTTFLSLLIPGSYDMKWQYTMPQILGVFAKARDKFWASGQRTERAAKQGLTPLQATILASIVEDETLRDSEKDKIAGVYLNRLRKGMRLSADPTVKFALKDFDIKRILLEDLKVQSPYNTYMHKGLPPGPICTPDSVTVEAVLNAPQTDFLYFVAKPDFSGYHNFTADYQTHLVNAKKYQEALDARGIKK